jgi:hypothetical protein
MAHEMAELFLLGAQLADIILARRHLQGDAIDDLKAIAFEADDFARIVGQKAHASYAERAQNLGTDAIIP